MAFTVEDRLMTGGCTGRKEWNSSSTRLMYLQMLILQLKYRFTGQYWDSAEASVHTSVSEEPGAPFPLPLYPVNSTCLL